MADPFVLEFSDVSSGALIGRVRYDGALLLADPSVRSLIQDMTPDDVIERFDGWSNGYVVARRPGEKRPRPQGSVMLPPTEETDAAVTELVETNRFVDTTTGEEYEPHDAPGTPDTGDDDAEA
jgi:hypothetical protein